MHSVKHAAISLVFECGRRPAAAHVRALADGNGAFAVSHDPSAMPGHRDEAWLELLADGLTFDLLCLVPSDPCPLPEGGYMFDLPAGINGARLEAIELRPGPHLAGGETMMPVVRAMASLAAALCALPDVVAVAWHPARSWLGPRYYASIIGNWLEGGVFPGLGLVGLADAADGGMQSEGLAFFTDQELRIEPELTDNRSFAAKIAVRLIDRMVEHGQLRQAELVVGPDGRNLRLEPSANGRFVRVWAAG